MSLLAVFTTFPGPDAARAAADSLVSESLAACVQLLPGVESTYRWQGKIERSTEVLAIIKTTGDQWPALHLRLRELHPYEVPEIIALPASQSDPDYLQWVQDNLRPAP
jgi:periplasmic divalent cation tolerance protein